MESLAKQAVANYNEEITSKITENSLLEGTNNIDKKRDDYFIEAGHFIIIDSLSALF